MLMIDVIKEMKNYIYVLTWGTNTLGVKQKYQVLQCKDFQEWEAGKSHLSPGSLSPIFLNTLSVQKFEPF